MSSTLLLLQFASENVALFCGALFAGAATYVSLVEHPTMHEGGAELADSYILASHPRPAIFQTFFGLVGALSAILAGLAASDPWWIGAGVLLGAAVILQVSKVLPLTRRLAEVDIGADTKLAPMLYARLVRQHAALTLAGLASLCVFILRV